MAIYVAICAVITLVATVLMTDCVGRDISGSINFPGVSIASFGKSWFGQSVGDAAPTLRN